MVNCIQLSVFEKFLIHFHSFLDVNISHEIIQSDQGGGEAPAPVLDVNLLHLVRIYIWHFILWQHYY